MKQYWEAYEIYRMACENYGMESLKFQQFINYLTEKQLNEYLKKAN
ncbi:hypothetical protein [Bacillus dakarensis]|nr:hypothetical protein [Bacillus dakarensis]